MKIVPMPPAPEAAMPETRRRIMDTALALFSTKGFDSVSVRALAKEAGVNLAMISYYFGSKEALYHAVLEEKVETTRLRIIQVHDSKLSPAQKIAELVDTYVERVLSNAPFHRLMMRELANPEDSGIHKKLRDTLLKNMKLMTEIIDEGVAKKVFRHVDATLTIFTLIGPLAMLSQQPAMGARLFGGKSEDFLYNPKFKERVKAHLTEAILNHLLIPKR
jgi:AcrR family transcriptional regulator